MLNTLVSVALFLALCLAAFGGRPLTVTLLHGVRTFLPPAHYAPASDCLGLHHGTIIGVKVPRNEMPAAANPPSLILGVNIFQDAGVPK
jgi:hypothetical protein